MAKRRQSQWWKSGNLTNRTPEADQLKYDRGYQRLMSQQQNLTDRQVTPPPVEFTQPGPRRPGR